MKSQIFNAAIVLVLLFASPADAVKRLVPGDTVNGKKITEAYYAYDVDEQIKLIQQLESIKVLTAINQSLVIELDTMKQKVDIMRELDAKTASNTLKIIDEYDKSIVREEGLRAELLKADKQIKIERKRNRRSFWKGVATTLGTVVGAVKIINLTK